MARIFISHSSKDDHPALAVRDYLVSQGWMKDDIFLDISAHSSSTGLSAGERWRASLDQAQYRCEAVLFLISKNWLASKECWNEYTQAKQLNKSLFCLIVDETDLSELSTGFTATWQIVNLKAPLGSTLEETRFDTQMERALTAQDGDKPEQDVIHFLSVGLRRLKNGLEKVSLLPENFELAEDKTEQSVEGWRMPYRGLAPMEAQDAAVFFGRDPDIVRGLDVLRGLRVHNPPRCLVILGASGAGKSSFLRAGLLPRLKRDDQNWLPLAPIRTSDRGPYEGEESLLAALKKAYAQYSAPKSIAELKSTIGTLEGFRAALRELRQLAKDTTLMKADQEPPQIIISIDQAEEFFRKNPHAETTSFLNNLNTLIKEGELCCIAAIRSDRYNAMQTSETFKDIQPELLSLQPIATSSLTQLISGPAEMLKQHVPNAPTFSPLVVEALSQEMEDKTDALPLLAFTLSRLVHDHIGRVRPSGNIIDLDDLEAAGGIAGTIATEAQGALNDLPVHLRGEKADVLIRRAFIPRLARVNVDGRTKERRIARKTEFATDQLTQLIDAFVRRRLLTVKGPSVILERDENGNAQGFDEEQITVEVAHEALLRDWPLLSALLDAETSDLLLMENILLAAKEWEENDRSKEYINHRGARLEQANALVARDEIWREALKDTQDYLKICDSDEKKLQRRKQLSLVAILLSFLMFTTSVAGIQYFNARASDGATLQALEEKSRLLTSTAYEVDSELGTAFALALSLEGKNHNPKHRTKLIESVNQQHLLASQLRDLPSFYHPAGEFGAIYYAGDSKVITWGGGGDILLWDSITGEQLNKISMHSNTINSLKISKDKKTALAYSMGAESIFLIDLDAFESFGAIMELDDLEGAIFSTSGKYIIGWSGDFLDSSSPQFIVIWDALTGKKVAGPLKHYADIKGVFSVDEIGVLVSWSHDRTVKVWDSAQGTILQTLTLENSVDEVVLLGEQSTIMARDDEGIISFWDYLKGERIGRNITVSRYNDEFKLSSNETHIVSWGVAGVEVWDIRTREKVWSNDEQNSVDEAFISNGDKTLFTRAGYVGDNTIRSWGLLNGLELTPPMRHEDRIDGMQFSQDEALVLSWSDDRTLKLWDFYTGKQVGHTMRHDDKVIGGMFLKEENVLSWGFDGAIRTWDARSGSVASAPIIQANRIVDVSLSLDSRRILGRGIGPLVNQWNLGRVQKKRLFTFENWAPQNYIAHNRSRLISVLRKKNEFSILNANDGSLVVKGTPYKFGSFAPKTTSQNYLDHNALLYVAYIDDLSGIWRLNTMTGRSERLQNIALDDPSGISISNDGSKIAIWNNKGKIKVYESGSQRLIAEKIFASEESEGIMELAFLDNSEFFVIRGSNSIAIWSPEDESKTVRIPRYPGSGWRQVKSNLILFNMTGGFEIFNLETGRIISKINWDYEPLANMYVLSEQNLVIRAQEKGVDLWSASDGRKIQHISTPFKVNTVDVSTDGTLLLGLGYSQIGVWEISNGLLLQKVANDGRHFGASFSLDGSRVLAWGTNKIQVRKTSDFTLVFDDSYSFKNLSGVRFISRSHNIMAWDASNIYSVFPSYLESFSGEYIASENNFSIRQHTSALVTKILPFCLSSDDRTRLKLLPDPPCWCREKPYPSLSEWEDDYLSRHPELDLSINDGVWPEGKAKPNPFTHERSDGWTCPAKGTGYSAPWKAFPDIDALTVDELLGPAHIEYARLDELGIDY